MQKIVDENVKLQIRDGNLALGRHQSRMSHCQHYRLFSEFF